MVKRIILSFLVLLSLVSVSFAHWDAFDNHKHNGYVAQGLDEVQREQARRDRLDDRNYQYESFVMYKEQGRRAHEGFSEPKHIDKIRMYNNPVVLELNTNSTKFVKVERKIDTSKSARNIPDYSITQKRFMMTDSDRYRTLIKENN